MRKKNNQNKKKFFIELIDIMIPESENKLLPKASKVVKTDVLINLLFENSEFKKKTK